MAAMLAPVPRALKAATSAFLDVLMPPACVACKAPVATPNGLCAGCFATLPALPHPLCTGCGVPLPVRAAVETLCPDCRAAPFPFASALAPFAYSGPAQTLVLRLKSGGDALAPLMARLMRQAGPLPAGATLVPVPLHRWRLLKRGYNQSALLAAALARHAGHPHAPELLVRTRPTPPSRGLGREARAANVADAFAVPPSQRGRVAGATLVLVDDVLTTGATAAACAQALLAAGAATVHVRTFARVVREAAQPWLHPTRQGST